MKKNFFFIFLFSFILASFSYSQTLTQTDFLSVITPQYSASGTGTRLPVVFRAKLQNLTPGAKYRYYVQAALFSDLGSKNTGAGNPLFMNPDSATFVYSTNPSLTKSGAYSIFRTDASGSYTGWFSFVNTGNARFTPGNHIIPTIALGDSTGASVALRALSDSIAVLGFYVNATDTAGTGIWGKSTGNPKDLVLLYDSATGTGRPLSIAYIESEGTTIASVVKFYSDSVNGVAGNWGTIIPNHNANGVQRLEQRSLLADSLISTFTSSTGIWGDGVSTVNPTGGLTPIRFDTAQVKPTLISGSGTGQAKTFVLEQNYPNPFNPTTVIQFSVPKASVVKLRVFNALGQQVRLLFDGIANAGQTYSISLNARGLSSGIYYYSLITNATTLTRKMILLQ